MKRNYTLIEMLTVMAIIAILAGLIIPAVNKSRQRAKETQCLNNLRQIGIALTTYKSTHDDHPPMWLSDLTIKGKYLPQTAIYTCSSDLNIGEGRGQNNWRLNKPGDNGMDEVISSGNSAETAQCIKIYDYPRIGANRSAPPLKDGKCAINASYLYEFNGEEKYPWLSGTSRPSWIGESSITATGPKWQDYKMMVIRKGSDNDIPASEKAKYSFTKGRYRDKLAFFPMVRCFWHMKGFTSSADINATQDKPVFNVSVAGNVFSSLSYWEREGGTWK